ncbi:MAG: hypothetical protein IPH84_17330 [Bacteroidales bacterium]|nr:hypothetical protein [Bacteroidales bacterium]
MKYFFLITQGFVGFSLLIFASFLTSCNKETEPEQQDAQALVSIFRDTFLLHTFEYDVQNRLDNYSSFSYHYEIGPNEGWLTSKTTVYHTYQNDTLIKLANGEDDSNGYELYEYNMSGQLTKIKAYLGNNYPLYDYDLIYDVNNRYTEFTYQHDSYRQHRIFEYLGNNISKIIFYSDLDPNAKSTYEMVYDNKINPIHDLGIVSDDRRFDKILPSEFISENNILSYIRKNVFNEVTHDYTFNYSYDENGYPVWRAENCKYYSGGVLIQTVTDTLFYHYRRY